MSIDLATLYLAQGRWNEVEELTAQAVQLFQAHGVHQHALNALLLLHRSARARKLTTERLRNAAFLIRRAQHSRARHASSVN